MSNYFGSATGHYAASFSSTGEPHFYGFDGKAFDYQGEHNCYYNIITSSFLQLNSLFTDWPTTPNTNAMREVGIKIKTCKELIKIKLTDDGKSYINDLPNNEINFSGGAFGIRTIPLHFYNETATKINNLGIGIFINGYLLSFSSLDLFISYETDNVNAPYYNIMGGMKEPIEIDGIVGRTSNLSRLDINLGVYKTSSLFADDFGYNLFKE